MRNYKDKDLKVFLSYITSHRRLFAADMLCVLAVAAVDLAFPYVSRIAMNKLLPENMFSAFFAVMGVLAAAYLLRAGLYYVMIVVGHHMGTLVESDMRHDVFSHMQSLSCSFYDKNRTGILMSHITSDLFDITELAHHGPENILICALTIVGSLGVMFTLRWELALTLAVILPLCIYFMLAQRVRMKNANIEVKRKTADIYATIESSISGIRTAKAFANEAEENAKFEHSNELFRSSKEEYYRAMGLFQSGMEFTTGIMQVAVVAVGGFFIMRGKMDYVDLITFSLYVTTFVSPIRRLAQFAEQYMKGMAGFVRFLGIMRTDPDIEDSPGAADIGSVEGRIDYNDVSFDYGNGVPVLSHVQLHIAPGESLAVVGPSGGGKTTLCQLLPRLYDVCGGSVCVDGKDVRTVTQASLRKNIGIIQQDVFMFAGTIRENIRYGRPGATDNEIVEAAVRAEIHSEIMDLPDGYDTYIGERGVMLSGGQKQRISIARVFLKDPKILILDEATSALDTVTERHIQAALEKLSRGRTTLVVAHRLSTVKNSDIIAVVEGEHIAEMGSHAQLMSLNGKYAELCRAQTLDTED